MRQMNKDRERRIYEREKDKETEGNEREISNKGRRRIGHQTEDEGEENKP